MKIPYLSVIIPTHNRAIFLQRALVSINKQAHRDLLEIIVISDIVNTETDAVCSSLLRPTDIYIRRNGGNSPSASRNIGLKMASGKFIMFLDDDDSWDTNFFENFLSKQLDNIINIAYFNCNIIKETRPKSGPIKISETFMDMSGRLTTDVFVKNQVHMSCFIFSKIILQGLEFDLSMRAYEDWDFLLGVFEKQFPVHMSITCSNIFEVDDNTTDRRGSSADANNFNAPIDYLYVYRRHSAPSDEIRQKRTALLKSVNLVIPSEFL